MVGVGSKFMLCNILLFAICITKDVNQFIKSAGDLENDEKLAGVFVDMLQTADMIPISGDRTQKFKRMSG